MMVLRRAAKSDLDVRWPESDALILALGKACQAYEASLPAAGVAMRPYNHSVDTATAVHFLPEFREQVRQLLPLQNKL